ncbi:MAG: type II secretion system protein [Candidatus Pacebacteria bacterium]|nr:type II secretion system protein [Candidatus Paceibacterota bacterium]
MRRNKGFTLVETMVTIVVFSIVMLASAALLRIIFMNSTTSPNALNAVDQAQSAGAMFVNQVRDAAYGNDGSYPLGEASTTEVIFYSPYGTGSSTTVDRIRYFVANSTLYEGITVPSGSPASYNLANEKISTLVQHVGGVGTSTIFFYYNGIYAGTSTPLSQPVNINQVTYINLKMSVALLEQRNSTASSVISTAAAIRNLKTNLGN